MLLRERIQKQLELVRGITEAMLACFDQPPQWTFQVHPTSNHALWVVGHLGSTDNFILNLLAPEKVEVKPAFQERFGIGSRPTGNPADYPPVEEVLAFMRQRRGVVLDALSGKDDEALSASVPPGAPEFIGDLAAAFETLVWHETLHAGQVAVARRALGHSPLIDAPPA